MEQNTITDQLQELYDQMVANEECGKDWENIPVAKEMLRLLNEITDDEDKDFAKELCEAVLEDSYIHESNTPRLLLGFMEYRQSLYEDPSPWEDDIHRLKRLLDPKVPENEKLDLMRQQHRLLYDPVQLTEAWEDCIYDVLKECAECFQGQRRYRGQCFTIWAKKKEILEQHGIMNWRSPKIMNPRVHFD